MRLRALIDKQFNVNIYLTTFYNSFTIHLIQFDFEINGVVL